MEDVTRADVIAFHHELRATPYQANRAASMLSKLFNMAEDWGLRQAGTNPARRIKKNREEEKKRYLSDEEQARHGALMAEVLEDGSESVHTVSAILLLIYTGCRLNEILTLRWDYVTTHHHELPDSKTGRRRTDDRVGQLCGISCANANFEALKSGLTTILLRFMIHPERGAQTPKKERRRQINRASQRSDRPDQRLRSTLMRRWQRVHFTLDRQSHAARFYDWKIEDPSPDDDNTLEKTLTARQGSM